MAIASEAVQLSGLEAEIYRFRFSDRHLEITTAATIDNLLQRHQIQSVLMLKEGQYT